MLCGVEGTHLLLGLLVLHICDLELCCCNCVDALLCCFSAVKRHLRDQSLSSLDHMGLTERTPQWQAHAMFVRINMQSHTVHGGAATHK